MGCVNLLPTSKKRPPSQSHTSTSDSKLSSGVDANSHVPMRDAISSVRTVTTVAQANNAFPESSTRIVHDVSDNSFLHTSITSHTSAPPPCGHSTVIAARSRSPKRWQMHANADSQPYHVSVPGLPELTGALHRLQHLPPATAHGFILSATSYGASLITAPPLTLSRDAHPLGAVTMLTQSSSLIKPLTAAIIMMRSCRCIQTLALSSSKAHILASTATP